MSRDGVPTWAMRLPRGKTASVGVAVELIGGRHWRVITSARGRREMSALIPACHCDFVVCTLTHTFYSASHRFNYCHRRPAGMHLEHIAVYVGELIASYGCTGVRRPVMLRVASANAAIRRVAA